MSIDWFTVTVQLLNFLILIYLIKRLLYKPVLKIIARRKESYQQQQQEIVTREEKANQILTKYEQLQTNLEDQRQQILTQAETDAKNQYNNLLQTAKTELATQKKQWQLQFDQQVKTTVEQFNYRLLTELCRLSEQIVTDLAGSQLQKHAIDKFIDMLQTIDESVQKKLSAAWKRSKKVHVITAKALDIEEKNKIVSVLKTLIGIPEDQHVEIEWQQEASMILGITMKLEEWQLNWSIHSYIDRLEKSLYDNLDKAIDDDS